MGNPARALLKPGPEARSGPEKPSAPVVMLGVAPAPLPPVLMLLRVL